MNRLTLLLVFLCSVVCLSSAQGETTTQAPTSNCSSLKSCGDCVTNKDCFWCNVGNTTETKSLGQCYNFQAKQLWPSTRYCGLSDSRYLVCWLNMQILIIVVSCVGALILLSCACTIYCCCCRGESSATQARNERRWDTRLKERLRGRDAARTERQRQADSLRAKYGLNKAPRYSEFNNETS